MAMTTVSRRFRFIPIQILLTISAIFILIVMWTRLRIREGHTLWRDVRDQELKKFQMNEVSIDFIRRTGIVDEQIRKLTDEQINSMNDTQLTVTVHSFLDNTDTLCQRRMRMGALGDGGWEICDDAGVRPRFTPENSPCLVYSFGRVDDFSFEYDMSRVYKCEVHAFDKDWDQSDANKSDSLFVHPYGIGRYTEFTPEGNEFYTFKDILSIHGHQDRTIDVIKMDIESAEWSVLYHMLAANQLDHVKQLLVEFHVGSPANEERMRRSICVLRSLNEAGFRKFYVHKSPKGNFHHPHFPVVRAKNYELHYLNSNFLKQGK